jgi:hypothetical protein
MAKNKSIIEIILAGLIAMASLIYDMAFRDTFILLRSVFDLLWKAYFEIPMRLGEFQEKLQIAQYFTEIIQNITNYPLIQGLTQSISPFLGLISILLGVILFCYFEPLLIEILDNL